MKRRHRNVEHSGGYFYLCARFLPFDYFDFTQYKSAQVKNWGAKYFLAIFPISKKT
jgi:hypothetical protein